MSTNLTFFKFWKTIQNRGPEFILETPSFFLRTASNDDAKELAALLTLSFHGDDPWMEMFHPILRFGIYEDLRFRIQSNTASYACMVACQSENHHGDGMQESTTLNTASARTSCSQATPCKYLSNSVSRLNVTQDLGDRPSSRIMGTVELSVKRRPLAFLNAQCLSQYVYVSNLATHPDFRRRGVAQHLLKGCEIVAQRWGFQDIYLHVLENNTEARSLYQKLGYQLKRSEVGLSTWLLGQPKQLLLGKSLSVGNS